MMARAFQEGARAYYKPHDCPYSEGTPNYIEWHKGYEFEKNQDYSNEDYFDDDD